MSSSFTPPSPSSWEGPDQKFTPPPPSSWQGPAKASGEPNMDPLSDPSSYYKTGATPMSMLGDMAVAPLEGLWNAPGQVLNWALRGGRQAAPSLGTGGFLSEDPYNDAFGNAIGAVLPGSGPQLKQAGRVTGAGIRGGLKAIPGSRATIPAGIGGGLGLLFGGKTGAAIGTGVGMIPGVLEGVYQGIQDELHPVVKPPKMTPAPALRGSSLERMAKPPAKMTPPPPLHGSSLPPEPAGKFAEADIQSQIAERNVRMAQEEAAKKAAAAKQETAVAIKRTGINDFDWKQKYPTEEAQKAYLNRTWHALFKDIEVEGSPEGSKAPSATNAAREAYGKKWMTETTPDEMHDLILRVIRDKRVPGYPPPMTPPPK